MYRRISLSPLPASPVKSGEPFMMMAMREPPSFGFFDVGEHVKQEQELAVAYPRQPRTEPAQRTAFVLSPDRSRSSRFQSFPYGGLAMR